MDTSITQKNSLKHFGNPGETHIDIGMIDAKMEIYIAISNYAESHPFPTKQLERYISWFNATKNEK